MDRLVGGVRSTAEMIFWLIRRFVVRLVLCMAKAVSWATGNDGEKSGIYGIDQVKEILAAKEAEMAAKFANILKAKEEEKEAQVDEVKAVVKSKSKEIKKLTKEITDEKNENSRLVDMVRCAEEAKGEASKEVAKAKARMAKEIYAVTLGEAEKYLAFLNFLSEEFLRDSSDVLSDLTNEQKIFVERIKQDPIFKRDVEPTKLFKVHCPNKPDFDNLRMDIQKKLAKVNSLNVTEAPSLSGAPSNSTSQTIPDVLRRLIGQVQQVFPDLSDIEVYEKILAIKASNRGSLAGLTGRKVVDIISAEIGGGGGVDSDEDGGSSTASGDSLGQCAICIEPMSHSLGAQKLHSLDGCQHTFHEGCIKQWLSKKRECPCCRKYRLPDMEYPPLLSNVASRSTNILF